MLHRCLFLTNPPKSNKLYQGNPSYPPQSCPPQEYMLHRRELSDVLNHVLAMKQSGLHMSFGGRCRWGKSGWSLPDVGGDS